MGANDSHGGNDVGGGVASKDDSSVIPVPVIGVGFNYVHVVGGVGWKERSAEHRKWRVNKDREFAGHGDDVQGVARKTIPHRQYGIIVKDFGSAFDKVIGKSKMSKFLDDGKIDVIVIDNRGEKGESLDYVREGTVSVGV